MSQTQKPPLTIGVFGGSFNPVHLGHALLAITTQQTKAVDEVVLVPVYKHAVKRNLLPFHDRVQMCQLAIASFGNALSVSTIEEEVKASNGTMLKALKTKYPKGTRFVWICGDDFVRWMDKPKGIETLQEVSGFILQRRLHKQPPKKEEETSATLSSSSSSGQYSQNRFIQEPLDEMKIRRIADQLQIDVDYIYGELPHFSSTLVRRAPGNWRSFLTQTVVQYLDERPHLLQQLIDNLDEDIQQQEQQEQQKKKKKKKLHHRSPSTLESLGRAGTYVLQGLDVVHALQLERGNAGMALSTGQFVEELKVAQERTDQVLSTTTTTTINADDNNEDSTLQISSSFEEVLSLLAELQRAPAWLQQDRNILKKHLPTFYQRQGVEGWRSRLSLVEKFNARIEVFISATVRALVEILENHSQSSSGETVDFNVPQLLLEWCEGKEALGRLRAFVCAAGPKAPQLVQTSLPMRDRLVQVIENKDRLLSRVIKMEAGLSSRLSSPETLHQLLQNIPMWEYKLMGSFSPSTSLSLIHHFLCEGEKEEEKSTKLSSDDFQVKDFFEASTATIDFLLSFAKALAASACATG